MNYKKILEKLGLTEGIDFELSEISFVMLPKFYLVEGEEQEYTPDSPAEEILNETWKDVQLEEFGDIALLINEYLKDKNDLRTDDDDINIVGHTIFRWGFVNISQPTIDELIALIPTVTADKEMRNLIREKSLTGKKFKEDCDRCLDLITGFNDGRLTLAQIQTMMTTFAPINQALSNRFPKSAKALIKNMTPDGTIVTQQMKDACLYVLKAYPDL